MLNYYRLLGIGPNASPAQIAQAYTRQRDRLRRRAPADPALRHRLAEVEAGYGILAHPRRRLMYDQLLAQQPAPPPPASEARLLALAPWARRLNAALLALCLLLGLDWALPLREYPAETVQSRFPIAVSSSLSDPQLAYRVHTPHTSFRLPSAIGYRVREGDALHVWQTPLLGVVQRISAPASPDGPAPFQPYGGTIYGTFFLLPLLLAGVAAVGCWPGRSPELVVNAAGVAVLLAVLTAVVLLWF
ncbi:hypothetical protein MON38_16580 [Hymenobacter sp. DH14]|uniref:J domain-containing protein n=1 Tax=Hymenobacter cyanobacteriorum TaxID=2926463 RepID=A0A9X1VMU2_9BACT|nr:hypothetical protein [Hymenobacter cyanobacteriorum]MCI1189041.1 hypothetical protein [Hymenobacter cyanobacteriorum]